MVNKPVSSLGIEKNIKTLISTKKTHGEFQHFGAKELNQQIRFLLPLVEK